MSYKNKKHLLSNGCVLFSNPWLDTKEEHTAHGFRSTFSTMAHNSRKWQYEAIEAALSHMHGSDVAMIYNRSAYLSERKELMQWWADECDKMRESMGTYGKA